MSTTELGDLCETIDVLAALGEKRAGTAAGKAGAEWIRGAFVEAGLEDVRLERFAFPFHHVDEAVFEVNGAAAPGFRVLEASGGGRASASLMPVGGARETELAPLDVRGRVVLVEQQQGYHRSAQLANVAAAGAAAAVFVSAAPDNLIQVGSVRREWEAMAPIPALSIGADDGAGLLLAPIAGRPAIGRLSVATRITRGIGANVVGIVPGADATAGHVLCCAHHDTWFTGSVDNGSGVAALLAVAAALARAPRPRRTVVFAAFDGEELGLYGAYAHLRRHGVHGQNPIVAVINLEMPSARRAPILGIARSDHPSLDLALRGAPLPRSYNLYAGMELVPRLFGGTVPTDVQGFYRAGFPSASTACLSHVYHTEADTPGQVDVPLLGEVVVAFVAAVRALAALDEEEPRPDPNLWRAAAAPRPCGPGDPLLVDVHVSDSARRPIAGAWVRGVILTDDFFYAAEAGATTGERGEALLAFAGGAPGARAPRGFLHVTAGAAYPLVERVITVPAFGRVPAFG